MNSVIISGRLGKDLELRTTGGGTSVADMSVATSERIKSGDEWKDHTEWHRVTVWGKTAENAAKYLTKGSFVIVQGHIRTEKWQDKDGKDRFTTKIVADSVEFGPKGGSTGAQSGGSDSYSGPAADDDIPF